MRTLQALLAAAFVAGIAPCVNAAVVSGVVRYDGHPLPGVVVTMRAAEETHEQVTGADGRYCLECTSRASCTLTAKMAGLDTVSRKICFAPPLELELHMTLSPVNDYVICLDQTPMPTPVEKAIIGNVTDGFRQPVSNAVVWIDEESYRGCQEGKDGQWELREMIPEKRTTIEPDEHGDFAVTLLVVGPVRITASAIGRQSDRRKLDLAANRELKLVLLPGCSETPSE